MLNIKVVGPGCLNCNKLEQMCRNIVEENNLEANIEKISDLNKFAELGILMTPGLIINNKVISSGKVPVKGTLEKWILDAVQN